MTTTAPPATSADMPAASWSGKLAAYSSRGVPDDDERIVACRAALAFHRVLKVIQAERTQLTDQDADALQRALRAPQSCQHRLT